MSSKARPGGGGGEGGGCGGGGGERGAGKTGENVTCRHFVVCTVTDLVRFRFRLLEWPHLFNIPRQSMVQTEQL